MYALNDKFCKISLWDLYLDLKGLSVLNYLLEWRYLDQSVRWILLFSLVCQALWNYAIDCRKLYDVIDVEHLHELEDILVYLLEAYNEAAMSEDERDEKSDDQSAWTQEEEERGDLSFEAGRFCQVALTLLKRILEDSPRKVELLLND